MGSATVTTWPTSWSARRLSSGSLDGVHSAHFWSMIKSMISSASPSASQIHPPGNNLKIAYMP